MHKCDCEYAEYNDSLPDAVQLRVRVDCRLLDPVHEPTALLLQYHLSPPAQFSDAWLGDVTVGRAGLGFDSQSHHYQVVTTGMGDCCRLSADK